MSKKNIKNAGRPVSNISVPKQTIEFWLGKYQVGDFTEINLKKKIGRPTIRKAFRGNASQKNMDKITEFYKERDKGKRVIYEKIKLAKLS